MAPHVVGTNHSMTDTIAVAIDAMYEDLQENTQPCMLTVRDILRSENPQGLLVGFFKSFIDTETTQNIDTLLNKDADVVQRLAALKSVLKTQCKNDDDHTIQRVQLQIERTEDNRLKEKRAAFDAEAEQIKLAMTRHMEMLMANLMKKHGLAPDVPVPASPILLGAPVIPAPPPRADDPVGGAPVPPVAKEDAPPDDGTDDDQDSDDGTDDDPKSDDDDAQMPPPKIKGKKREVAGNDAQAPPAKPRGKKREAVSNPDGQVQKKARKPPTEEQKEKARERARLRRLALAAAKPYDEDQTQPLGL